MVLTPVVSFSIGDCETPCWLHVSVGLTALEFFIHDRLQFIQQSDVITLLLIVAVLQTCEVCVSVCVCFHHIVWEAGCVYKLFAGMLFI